MTDENTTTTAPDPAFHARWADEVLTKLAAITDLPNVADAIADSVVFMRDAGAVSVSLQGACGCMAGVRTAEAYDEASGLAAVYDALHRVGLIDGRGGDVVDLRGGRTGR